MTVVGDLTVEVVVMRISLSILLGGIMGIERGAKNQAAGIRTYILVCLASAMVMMINEFIVIKYQTGDPTRMGAQVISGLGFLGAGTILVTEHQKIRGLTTAAGLWACAVVGLATGIGFYIGALITAVALVGIMTLFTPVKSYLNQRSKIVDFHIILDSMEAFNRVLIFLNTSEIKLLDLQTGLGKVMTQDTSSSNQVTCYLSVKINQSFSHLRLMEELSSIAGVLYIQEVK